MVFLLQETTYHLRIVLPKVNLTKYSNVSYNNNRSSYVIYIHVSFHDVLKGILVVKNTNR